MKGGIKLEDITMCTANGCPMADKCYRHSKGDLDDIYQNYYNFEYTCNEGSGFEDYLRYIKVSK